MGRSRKKLSDQPFELDIHSQDAKGLGLAVFEEKKLHVFDALAGEKVRARYLFGRSNRGRAETLEVLSPSAERVEARSRLTERSINRGMLPRCPGSSARW